MNLTIYFYLQAELPDDEGKVLPCMLQVTEIMQKEQEGMHEKR